MKSLLRELLAINFFNLILNNKTMNKFEYENLKLNDFFKLILDQFYDRIHNFGHQHYGENFGEKEFYENINIVLHQIYQIKTESLSVIKFKNDFLAKKNESIQGIIEYKSDNKVIKKDINFKGHFVYYSLLIYNLFLICFHRELEEKVEYYQRLSEILHNNYIELSRNPINCKLFEVFSETFGNSIYTVADKAEYLNILLDELKKDFVFEEESLEAALIEIDEEELVTVGSKIMFMKEIGIIDFLVEKYNLKYTPSKLSRIISSCTDFKFSTVNGIINPIFNSSNAQKNNPYKTPQNKVDVKAKIIKLGLK